jgi:hypothetical protein
MLRSFMLDFLYMFVKSAEYNSPFVGLGGWGLRGSEQKFGCKSVDDKTDRLNI